MLAALAGRAPDEEGTKAVIDLAARAIAPAAAASAVTNGRARPEDDEPASDP
jgi:hypothetical protein